MIKCLSFREINKGTLVGYAKIHDTNANLIINDMQLFRKEDRVWATMPSRMYEKDGEKKYFSIIEFPSREEQNAYMSLVLSAIKEFRTGEVAF